MYLETIEKIDDISDKYKAIICDIWGVLHNGVELYQPAIAALRRMKAKGKYVILLTNAPKCSDIIQKRFSLMGATDIFWNDTVTSGDMVQNHLMSFEKKPKVFHWGLDDDLGLYEGTDTEFTQKPEDSDIIVCTGLLGSQTEISSQEVAMLNAAAEKKIPFICANPDRSVQRGNTFLLCAGSLADIYMELGGDVSFYGKPHNEVYEYCFSLFNQMDDNIQKQDILCIGDGLYTDIKGAQNAGLDMIFIKNGLHKELFMNINPNDEFTNLRTICEENDVMPDYVMDDLL